MVLEFQKEKQKQKMLIGVLVVIVLVAVAVIWYGYFGSGTFIAPAGQGQGVYSGAKDISIDFNTLKSEELKNMESFTEISAYSGEIGKPDLFKLTGKLLKQELASETSETITPPEIIE